MHLFFVRRTIGLIALVLLLGVGTGPSPVQGQPVQLSEQSRVSLITILPGDPIYTFAGHSAFRVQDPALGLDRLYNYGTFSFNDPFFVPKFTYGDLRYFLSVTSYAPSLRVYKQQGRPIIEQHLNLTREQRSALYRFLRQNARPENRYYQYDFFFDNCSTRIRDALTTTLGSSVDFSAAPAPDRSFRRLLDPYVASRPLLDLGFDLALGLPADRTASAWEAMFLPEHLMEAFDHATISANGRTRPLVADTDTVQWIANYDATTAAVDWPFSLSGLFLVLVLGWTSWQATQQHVPTGRGDALLFAVIGGLGVVMCYLWLVSTYTVTNNNLNLLWAWPTHLLAAFFLLRWPQTRGLRLYLGLTAGSAAVVALGWSVWPQTFHAAVLPLILAVGVRAGWWALLSPARREQRSVLASSSAPLRWLPTTRSD
jgi:hypothetical protein